MTKAKTGRKKTRELLMQLIFQMTALNDFSQSAKERFLTEHAEEIFLSENETVYFDSVLLSVCAFHTELDQTIQTASDNWKITRISKVDLAILRLATAEILYVPEIPKGVSVNEAVLLAKEYGGEDSYRFINGVLGKIVRAKDVPGEAQTS
jgi:N utilization substance protein B